MKTVFEVNTHYENDMFSHCTVTPVIVLREGILPGCSAESFTGKDHNGRLFTGSLEGYHASEQDAWLRVRQDTIDGIVASEKRLREEERIAANLRAYLAKLDKSDSP